MKHPAFRLMIATLASLVVLLAAAPAALAKTYGIPAARLTLVLEQDGSLRVTEERTFRFNGEFSHVYQLLRFPDRSTVTDLALSENGRAYLISGDQSPGTYSQRWEPDGLRLDWYIKAVDTDRTFTLTYRVQDAVRMHQDSAELYWQVVGSEWEVPTDLLDVRLTLPGEPLDLRAEESGSTLEARGRDVHLTRHGLPASRAVPLRVLLAKSAVPLSTLPPDRERMQRLPASGMPPAGPVGIGVQIGWLVLGLGTMLWFYPRYVRRPRFRPEELTDPEPLAPALIARLTSGTAVNALRATLLDMARVGAITVEQGADGDWLFTWVQGEPVALQPFERQALDIFFPDSLHVTLSEWKATRGTDRKAADQFRAWWIDVRKLLPRSWRVRHQGWVYVPVALVIPVLFTGFSAAWVLCIIMAFVLLMIALLQRQYSTEGYRQRTIWEHIRRRLAYHGGPQTDWEVAVAVALGLKATKAADPTGALAWGFPWLHDTADALDQSTFMWVDSGGADGGGGGGGGGDGGGGGGAS